MFSLTYQPQALNRLENSPSPSIDEVYEGPCWRVQAGVKGIPITFLMTDNQIVKEKFLVYINDLLSTGYIADLCTQVRRLLQALSHAESHPLVIPSVMNYIPRSQNKINVCRNAIAVDAFCGQACSVHTLSQSLCMPLAMVPAIPFQRMDNFEWLIK